MKSYDKINRQSLVEWAFDSGLFEPGEKILVAVSGGADSMVMLELLSLLSEKIDLEVEAMHVNFGLRGDESERDQHLVQRRCKQLDIFLHIQRVDDLSVKDSNLEEKARDLRHSIFKTTASEVGASAIAVGHTLDDQAETIMLRLLRGSGLRGMSAMSRRDGILVRPLLGVRRATVRSFAKERGIAYRDDASNEDERFARNRVRNLLIPLIEKNFNENFVQTLTDSAAIINADESFMDDIADTIYRRFVKEGDDKSSIKSTELIDLPLAIQRRLVRKMIQSCVPRKKSVSHSKALNLALEALKKSDNGMKLDLGSGLTLVRKQGILTVTFNS